MSEKQKLESFLVEYGKALDDRTASLFIGAGLSVPAGYIGWSDLIGDIAKELDLDIKRERDFVTVAQFYINENKKVRRKLTQRLLDVYGGKPKKFTENHQLLASLPIETVWTTNYDPLIENAFESTGKIVDVKRNPKNLTKHIRGRDATVYKMHGDVTSLEDAILIKDDYEVYGRSREAFSTALRGDLVSKTFLFLGFSFTDPNIDYLLSRIRLLMDEEVQTHYCIMRWPKKVADDPESEAQYRHDRRRQELLRDDLIRYGIEALMVDEWSEITDILRHLHRRVHQRNIFVSGSAAEYGDFGEERILGLSRSIGEKIIKDNYNLISGFGVGIGEAVLSGALQTYYKRPEMSLVDRITMYPFPQYDPNDTDRQKVYTKHRQEMLMNSGYTIFVCGNKIDKKTGKVVPGDGILEEFTIATEQGKIPIPIGATGSAAKIIWDEVMAEPKKFFPGETDVTAYLQILGDVKKTNDELIEAVFGIIRKTSRK